MSTAVDLSAKASVVGIKTSFVNLQPEGVSLLPQRIAVIGQGNSAASYSTDKATLTSAGEVGSRYGFGSPLHLAALELLPDNGDGVGTIPVTFYPLEDGVGAATAAGDITPAAVQSVASSYVVKINEINSLEFVIAVGDSVADIVTAMTNAINAVLEMPVIATDNATDVGLAAKWGGASGNDIKVEVVTPLTGGATFAITQPTGGAVNPDVDVALNQFGTIWETLVLNCLNQSDTNSLDKIQTFGEGRWGALVRKPFTAWTGNTEADVAAATTISDARKLDRINGQLVAPGSNNLPLVVAARQLARIAVIAQNNPPQAYGSQQPSGLVPGADADQWTYADRDQAIKAGSSGIEVRDGQIFIADVVTFYHPTGDANPAYQYLVDIVKVSNIIKNLDDIFVSPNWDSVPLIPDDQPTVNRSAKKPKDAKAAIATMIDNLGLNAFLSDPETAKTTITAVIDSANPKRLNISLTVQLSGNVKIISIDFNFGFFFGSN